MKHCVLIIIGGFLLMLTGCRSYDYSVSGLKKDEIRYSELPIEVKKYLLNPSSYRDDPSDDTDFDVYYFICLDSISFYEVETINTIIGLWVDYIKLKDNKNNLSYRIDLGMATPYIVFDEKLYICKDFNPLTKIKGSKDLSFYCYYLKGT